jgi:ribose-phosphate pyrophosphokinase
MTSRSPLALFSLGTEPALTHGVADHLGVALDSHEERAFEDGEHKLRPLSSVRGRDVYVLAGLAGDADASVNDRLCRLLFFIGALRDAGAATITAVAPYLCYARKDRKTKSRDPVTTRYVACLFEAVGLDRIVTLDVHNLAAYQNAFRISCEHLEARGLWIERSRHLAGGAAIAVVSPDPGGFHRAEALRDSLVQAGCDQVELAMLGKHRSEGQVRSEAFVGNVDGRVALIVDDLVSTGTTLVRAADACRRRGARAVHALVTHGVFSAAAADVLAGPSLDSLTITSSLASSRLPSGPARERIAIIDVAPLLAGAISALHHDGSLVALAVT